MYLSSRSSFILDDFVLRGGGAQLSEHAGIDNRKTVFLLSMMQACTWVSNMHDSKPS